MRDTSAIGTRALKLGGLIVMQIVLAECDVVHDVLLECAKQGDVPDEVYTIVESVHHLCF